MIKRPRHRRVRVYLASIGALAVAGTAAGLALSSADPVEEAVLTPIDYAGNGLVETQPELLGLTPSAKLDTIVERMSATVIVSAEVGGPPTGAVGAQATGIAGPEPVFVPGKWAHFVVEAAAVDRNVIRGEWEASLAAGALRDALQADGDEPLAGITISARLPGGKIVPTSLGGIGNVVYQQRFDGLSPDDIEPSIKAAADKLGLTITDFALLKAAQPAPAVIAQTNEPEKAVEDLGMIWDTLVGNPPRYEGFYLQITDSEGDAVAVSAIAYRLGAGIGWIRPDLDPRPTEPPPTPELAPREELPG